MPRRSAASNSGPDARPGASAAACDRTSARRRARRLHRQPLRLLVFVLAALGSLASPDAASAFETPAQRWEYWTERATRDVRSSARRDGDFAGHSDPSGHDRRVRRLSTVLAVAVGRPDESPGMPARPGNRAAYASQPPVWAEADGIRVGADPLLVVEQGSEVRLTGAAWSRPGARWCLGGVARLTARSGGPWNGTAAQAWLARRGGHHDIVLGTAPIRWGEGMEGGLLIGRTARPLPQFRWVTARPLGIAPFLRLPGTWSGDQFLAWLDDDARKIPRPLLLGQRFAWQPVAEFEVAVARTALFGGRGRTRGLKPRDLGNILIGRNENRVGARGPGDSDQRASFTLRASLPPSWRQRLRLDGGECFWEYAGEDMITPPIPAAVAHHYGATAVWRGWEARGEVAETQSENRWYDSHTLYGDAHFYRGLPLGLSQGADLTAVRTSLTTPPGGVRGRLTRVERVHGETADRRELRVAWIAEAKIDLRPGWVLEAEMSRTRRIGPGRDPAAPPLQRDFASLRVTHRPIPAP